jgi:COP9 signalosome complex subunit 5
MHARSGGKIEVMGLLQGRVEKDCFIVMDAFALPVEATEVRVNAQAEAYEYMVNYLSMGEEVRSFEPRCRFLVFAVRSGFGYRSSNCATVSKY